MQDKWLNRSANKSVYIYIMLVYETMNVLVQDDSKTRLNDFENKWRPERTAGRCKRLNTEDARGNVSLRWKLET